MPASAELSTPESTDVDVDAPTDPAEDADSVTSGAAEPSDPALVSARAEAVESGERVEIVEERSEWDTLWAEPTGELTLETSIAATRTKVGTEDGEWRSIDTTLEKSENGVTPVAPALPMTLSPGGDERPLARLERGEEWLEYWWPDALPEPELAGDHATYPNVFDGVDLVVSVSPDGTGFSEVLMVTSAAAAARLPEGRCRCGWQLRMELS